jgi:hypothetical protein
MMIDRSRFNIGFVAAVCLALFLMPCFSRAFAEIFALPSPNHAIFEPGGQAEYFVPTPGRSWESGTYGCVRSEGYQMHEGLDIKCTQRDRHGEPIDPIYASASGRVAYMNSNSGLSNYGKYVVLRHEIEGIPIYTTYAHLSAFAKGLSVGDKIEQGQVIATMGRTSNTRQGISKERAHVHFEIDLRLSDRFIAWHKANQPGQRNDHGNWNGRNLVGLDPRLVLLEQHRLGSKFSLLEFIRGRTDLCHVLLRDSRFAWVKEYAPLVRRNASAEKEGVAGYEIALDYSGLPFLLIPRTKAELGSGPKIELKSVNEAEQRAHPCRKLVVKRSKGWDLANNGRQLLELLAY